MTQEQALAALEQLTKEKKVFKNSMAYRTAKTAIEQPGVLVICGGNVGSGRYAGSKSWQEQTATILRLVGVVYARTNISPKGGKAGDRITVISL